VVHHSLTRVPSYCDGGGGSDPARVGFPAAVRLVFVAQRHLLCFGAAAAATVGEQESPGPGAPSFISQCICVSGPQYTVDPAAETLLPPRG